MEITELFMNPARQRILQQLLIHETGTVKELRKALPDIPSASLYRHMKLLTEAGILSVVGENRVRGTVESIYRVNKGALEIDDAKGLAVQAALLGICASFAKYFSGDSPEPRKDMLMMTTCTLSLTDGEFMNFLSEINQVAVKYMDTSVKQDSKTRQITLISAPVDGQVR